MYLCVCEINHSFVIAGYLAQALNHLDIVDSKRRDATISLTEPTSTARSARLSWLAEMEPTGAALRRTDAPADTTDLPPPTGNAKH